MNKRIIKYLYLVVVFVCISCAQERPSNANVWQEVQKRTDEASKGLSPSKARTQIWRELKKLSPRELMQCAEEVCKEAEQNKNDEGVFYVVNPILCYHAKKTSWNRTAGEVAKTIKISENPILIECYLEWVMANNHYKDISKIGINRIGECINKIVLNKQKSIAVKKAALKRVPNVFWMLLSNNIKSKIKKSIEVLCKDETSPELQKTGLLTQYLIDYTEWDYRRENGIEPIGERPIRPIFKNKTRSNNE